MKVGPADHAQSYQSFASKEIKLSFPLQKKPKKINNNKKGQQHVAEINSLENK